MSLLWLDLETTGLRADKCAVLEVAAIATTDDFTEIARISRTIYYPCAWGIVELLAKQHRLFGKDLSKDVYEQASADLRARAGADISPIVLEMHDKNGLWRDCIRGQALDTVDRDLEAFVKEHLVTTAMVEQPADANGPSYKKVVTRPQLAGSTISFDRAFINAHLPRLASEDVLHYRNLDVSTLNELAKRFWQGIYGKRPNNETKAHRGMADIEESIRVCKHYVRAFNRATALWTTTGGTLEELVAA